MPVTVQHAKNVTIADFTGTVTVGDSSGGSSTVAATNLARPSDWNSTHAITFTPTASEFSDVLDLKFFEPFPLPNTNSTLSAPGIGTWYFDPFTVQGIMTSGQINCLVSNAAGFLNGAVFSAASTGSRSAVQTFYNRLALYKHGTGASTSRMESLWTGGIEFRFTNSLSVNATTTSALTVTNALTASFPAQFDGSGGMTYSTTSQSGSTSVGASTGASTLANNLITGVVAYVSGARMDMIPFASTLGPGDYMMAHMFTSSSATSGATYTGMTMMSTHSRLGLLENAVGAYKRVGASVSNSTTNVIAFKGYLATTTSGASSIVNSSDMRATTGRMYWVFDVSSY